MHETKTEIPTFKQAHREERNGKFLFIASIFHQLSIFRTNLQLENHATRKLSVLSIGEDGSAKLFKTNSFQTGARPLGCLDGADASRTLLQRRLFPRAGLVELSGGTESPVGFVCLPFLVQHASPKYGIFLGCLKLKHF